LIQINFRGEATARLLVGSARHPTVSQGKIPMLFQDRVWLTSLVLIAKVRFVHILCKPSAVDFAGARKLHEVSPPSGSMSGV
jgi:hypothetical protein